MKNVTTEKSPIGLVEISNISGSASFNIVAAISILCVLEYLLSLKDILDLSTAVYPNEILLWHPSAVLPSLSHIF